MWFHVDGAYGAVAAQVPGAPASLRGLVEADSIAVDPHKWLYAPVEAGCILVRDPEALRNTFAYHPPYYQFDEQVVNFFEHGPQNSRGFRALKVWLALQQAGRDGYLAMIGDDMRLAAHLHACVDAHPGFEAMTHSLSITTFRFVPADLRPLVGSDETERYLDRLNRELLAAIERSGEAFLSSAVVNGRFALRACIVNFNTSLGDVEALLPLISALGDTTDATLRREPGVVHNTPAAEAPAHITRSR
jgi:glutamate/tyrosine decarboxylase-like PLP-dependent enzyme